MSDEGEESELAPYDVTLETTSPTDVLGRRTHEPIGAIPYEWLVSIRILLGKYFRGCIDCRGRDRKMPSLGLCAKCVQANRWMARLDYHLAGAKAVARRRWPTATPTMEARADGTGVAIDGYGDPKYTYREKGKP